MFLLWIKRNTTLFKLSEYYLCISLTWFLSTWEVESDWESFLRIMEPRASLVAQMVKNPPAMQETWVRSLGQEDPLEEGMATHCSILAWRIPWTEELGGLQSLGSQRVGHDWATQHKHGTRSKRISCMNSFTCLMFWSFYSEDKVSALLGPTWREGGWWSTRIWWINMVISNNI